MDRTMFSKITGSARLNIGVRFHFFVHSILCGAPVIGLSAGDNCRRHKLFAESFPLGLPIDLAEVGIDDAINKIISYCRDENILRERSRSTLMSVREAQHEKIKIVLSQLAKNRVILRPEISGTFVSAP
jgi:hypothetical protein